MKNSLAVERWRCTPVRLIALRGITMEPITESHSWHKPAGIENLIGRKQVDWSVFEYGTQIPGPFQGEFVTANGGQDVLPGSSHSVGLHIDGRTYPAKLARYPNGSLQIRWDGNNDLKSLLEREFRRSYEYLVTERQAQREQGSKKKLYVRTADPEYLELYQTDAPFEYRVDFVTATSATQRDFAQVWADLGAVIGEGLTIATLAMGQSNTVHWLGDEGIEVVTDSATQTIVRSHFAQVWETLRSVGVLTADQFPGQAQYRSSAIAAILALLPYIEYVTAPKVVLFLTDRIFTNDELVRTFGVGTSRGIRYMGNAGGPKHVVFVTGASPEVVSEEEDHPYHDRWDGNVLLYTGEGLKGDQTLSMGNLALANSRDLDFPVYGFQKRAANQYVYLGRFKAQGYATEEQPDSDGRQRSVYVFSMTKTNSRRVVPLPTTSDANPLPEVTPAPFSTVAAAFAEALRASCLTFGVRHDAVARTFLASLATKRFVILTGLSGSGKSQIAIRFGEWLGAARCLILAVRPDWTGPEALLGYEDALQSAVGGRSAWHVPAPLAFMLAAARDPGRSYLLVLDEMNLAHVILTYCPRHKCLRGTEEVRLTRQRVCAA